MSKIVMGYWDCASCGKSVPGKLRTCPSCSHSRGAEVKFYMKDVEFLSDEEAAKIGKKPDWLCEYCGTYNNDGNINCLGCGAVRGTDNTDYFDNNKEVERNTEKDESQWECAYCGAANPDSADHCGTCKAERCEKQKEPVAEKPKRKANPFIFLAIALGIVGLIVLGYFLSRPQKLDATVNDISWETIVYIEEQVTKTDSTTEKGQIPEGGVITRTEQEQYTEYEKVGSHIETEYKDLGNGTFEQVEVEVDDYDNVVKVRDVYYYSYVVWDVTRYVPRSGSGYDYSFATPELLEGERIKTDANRVTFKISVTETDGSKKVYNAEPEIAKQLEVGKSYTLSVKDNKIVNVK